VLGACASRPAFLLSWGAHSSSAACTVVAAAAPRGGRPRSDSWSSPSSSVMMPVMSSSASVPIEERLDVRTLGVQHWEGAGSGLLLGAWYAADDKGDVACAQTRSFAGSPAIGPRRPVTSGRLVNASSGLRARGKKQKTGRAPVKGLSGGWRSNHSQSQLASN
jgi:hypothetical protein